MKSITRAFIHRSKEWSTLKVEIFLKDPKSKSISYSSGWQLSQYLVRGLSTDLSIHCCELLLIDTCATTPWRHWTWQRESQLFLPTLEFTLTYRTVTCVLYRIWGSQTTSTKMDFLWAIPPRSLTDISFQRSLLPRSKLSTSENMINFYRITGHYNLENSNFLPLMLSDCVKIKFCPQI